MPRSAPLVQNDFEANTRGNFQIATLHTHVAVEMSTNDAARPVANGRCDFSPVCAISNVQATLPAWD
jgi:hypothetical protein